MKHKTSGRFGTVAALALLIAVVSARPGFAQNPANALFDPNGNIGKVTMEASCSEKALTSFRRGVALLHSFGFEDARKEFQASAEADPSCAMAYWGEAMSYYDSLHAPPTPDSVKKAQQAVEKALAAKPKTPREQAYVDAAKALLDGYPQPSRRDRDQAYNTAMRKVYEQFPDDRDGATLYALSLLALARRGVDNGPALQQQAVKILNPIFAELPEHPGAAHYVIHVYDDSGDRAKGLEAARRYAKISSGVTHALHMPSHIFAGVGMWDETIAANRASFAASDKVVRAKGQPLARRSYHAILYLMYSLIQKGQLAEARALLDEHRPVLQKGDDRARSDLQNLDVRYLLDTRDWKQAADYTPTLETPLEKAEALFVRGLGLARTDRLDAATSALDNIKAIGVQLEKETDMDVATRAAIVTIQARQLESAIRVQQKRGADAVKLMQEATKIEDGPGVNWAPPDAGTGIPAHEFFGEVLLQIGRPADAAKEFQAALKRTPRRLRSMAGLAKATAAAGDRTSAVRHYQAVMELLAQADAGHPDVSEAKAFLKATH